MTMTVQEALWTMVGVFVLFTLAEVTAKYITHRLQQRKAKKSLNVLTCTKCTACYSADPPHRYIKNLRPEEDVCDAQSNSWHCTRERGHTGLHMACGLDFVKEHPICVWGPELQDEPEMMQ